MKKESRRSKVKHPGLNKTYNLKIRQELLDQDYIDKLSESDKEWLNKFNEEYISDRLDRTDRKKNLHKTKALIKDCDDRNNARNRDAFGITKSNNILEGEDKARQVIDSKISSSINERENMLIAIIDAKNESKDST